MHCPSITLQGSGLHTTNARSRSASASSYLNISTDCTGLATSLNSHPQADRLVCPHLVIRSGPLREFKVFPVLSGVPKPLASHAARNQPATDGIKVVPESDAHYLSHQLRQIPPRRRPPPRRHSGSSRHHHRRRSSQLSALPLRRPPSLHPHRRNNSRSGANNFRRSHRRWRHHRPLPAQPPLHIPCRRARRLRHRVRPLLPRRLPRRKIERRPKVSPTRKS